MSFEDVLRESKTLNPRQQELLREALEKETLDFVIPQATWAESLGLITRRCIQMCGENTTCIGPCIERALAEAEGIAEALESGKPVYLEFNPKKK